MALQRQTTLSKQTSHVFRETLEELQQTVAGSVAGGSGKLASMNIEEFLSTVWDHQAGAGAGLVAEPSPTLAAFSEALQQHAPSSLPLAGGSGASASGVQDYSGKTADEVWQAIQASKAAASAFEPITLGSVLQSLDMQGVLGADAQLASLPLPASSHHLLKLQEPAMPDMSHLPLPSPSAAPPAHELRLEDLSGAGMAQPLSLPEVHAMATIRMGGGGGGPQPKSGRPRRKAAAAAAALTASPPDSPTQEMPEIEAPPAGGAHSRVARQRKRKEPEVVDERSARLQKRMVKNRESAARSRARKQEYTAQLEVQVQRLRQENAALLEKIVRQCPPVAGSPARAAAAPLRRTRTMPTPALQALVECSPK